MKWPSLALDLDSNLQPGILTTSHSPSRRGGITESDVFLKGYKHLRGARI